MKKRLIAVLLCLILLLCAGCGSLEVVDNSNSSTGSSAGSSTGNASTGSTGTSGGSSGPATGTVSLTLAYKSADEKIANIVRDMLTKEGFDITLNTQSDQAGLTQQLRAGNYDIAIIYHGNPVYSPDAAAHTYMHSTGDTNYFGLSDPKLDELVETAALSAQNEWPVTYDALDDYAVDEMAYLTPLYRIVRARATNKILDYDTVQMLGIWWTASYADTALNASRTAKFVTTAYDLTTMDPIRANTPSMGTIATNLYIQLINLDDYTYEYITDGTLSRNYAVSEDGDAFYFLLRDDCFFTRVSADAQPVTTDVMVSGEDVVFSIKRCMDPNSVPSQVISANFTNVDDCYIVTDMSELTGTMAETGKSVFDELSAGLSAPISEIVEGKESVDNASGKYQVVCISTATPAPQFLNTLTTHYSGIVDSEWVSAINSQVDFANYQTTDVLYADTNAMYPGANFANTISCSGPYVLLSLDDYGMTVAKNDGYYRETGGANIERIDYVYLSSDAAVSAIRAGEVDAFWNIPASAFSVVDEDPNLDLRSKSSASTYFIGFNIGDESRPCSNVLVRKAVSACINQDDVVAAMGAVAGPVYSPWSCTYENDKVYAYVPGKAQEYLSQYFASIS